MRNQKEIIITQINKILDQKIETANLEIRSLKESLESENKCTVGDKYETGRARLQAELEKSSIQLLKIEKLKYKLSKIDLHKKYNNAEFGSLVITNSANYFISLAIGKIEVGNKSWFCISLASPIGKLLYLKKAGDEFIFNGKELKIKAII
ncbi:MAG: 3-oxoacyl-ACP synthase [Bacteroidota bacterium]